MRSSDWSSDGCSSDLDEVDLVMPYTRWLGGDVAVARDMIAACKGACGERVLLTVILETGRLRTPEQIYAAARDAIDAGADFILEERRGGKECVGTCTSRGSPYHHKKNTALMNH